MNKLIAAILIVVNRVSTNALPLQAQNVVTETPKCRNAITSVENQLRSGRQLSIKFSEINDGNYYPDHPKDRPNRYILGMGGNAMSSVMSSPVFLQSLAKQIIDSCNSISLITFGQHQSDYVLLYGLMPDGNVELFQCPEDFDYYGELTWGEDCPL